jgi:hypothetical protein
MRSSLVEIGGLVVHPRTINEIMHASPVDRMLIEDHTNNGLTAQSRSQSFIFFRMGSNFSNSSNDLSIRIDFFYREEACVLPLLRQELFCNVAYATSANGAREGESREAVKPGPLNQEVFSEACRFSSSVPQAPTSLGRSRPWCSTIWCRSTFPTFLFHRRAKRERLDRELV